MSTAVGDEGGFAPNLPTHEAAIELILEAIEPRRLHSRAGRAARPRLRGLRVLQRRQLRARVREDASSARREFADYLAELASRYPIISIEDGMAEDDWDGWKRAHRRSSASKIQLVGDDLFVTNTAILQGRHPPRASPTPS